MDLGDTYYGMDGDYEDEQIEHVPEENNPTNVQDTPIDAIGSGNPKFKKLLTQNLNQFLEQQHEMI